MVVVVWPLVDIYSEVGRRGGGVVSVAAVVVVVGGVVEVGLLVVMTVGVGGRW